MIRVKFDSFVKQGCSPRSLAGMDRRMGINLSIVIPTLNEVKGIARTLEQIQVNELHRLGYNTEVIVVDGGSTDGTSRVARKFGAKVITERARGYGRAYKTGLARAQGDVIVTLDGDGSYPAELIPNLVRLLLNNKLDFITANRLSMNDGYAIGGLNRLGNYVLSLTTRIIFHVELKDSQSGMWIFRKGVLKDIIDSHDGMAFSEEIKVKAFRRAGRVLEVPIPFGRRIGQKKIKAVRDGFSNLVHLLRLFTMSKVREDSNW
jgi:hypothetical protein